MDPAGELYEFFACKLPERKLALDAGCGDDSRYLARLFSHGWRVVGCDLSQAKLRRTAQLGGMGASFQAADLRALPYRGDIFDTGVCLRVLSSFFSSDIPICLKELNRVLRPGGVLVTNFLDRSDAEYGFGEQVEPGTFVEPGTLRLHFTDEAEIQKWFASWEISSFGLQFLQGDKGTRVIWNVISRKILKY